MINKRIMRVLHLNTNDIKGGAAIAAYRLHKGLSKTGIDSKMLVQKKHSDDPTVITPDFKLKKGWDLLKSEINKFPLRIFNTNQGGPWSINWLPTNIIKKIDKINPDIVHLHWIGNGFISIKEIGKIKKPIIWTMHDMWPFTGGFHLSNHYVNNDGSWISKQILKQKIKYWGNLNLTVVSPSTWLANQAKQSKLFKNKVIKVIPNCLDTQVFKPISTKIARNILNLPLGKKIILFGAMGINKDKNKGFDLLAEALMHFSKQIKDHENYLFTIFGGSRPKNSPIFKIKTKYLGRINDDTKLALIYSAADVFIIPSRQENLPNIIMEAMACTTPCVGFNIGGIPDMIDHKKNGYLAKPYYTKDLAKGIQWIIENRERNKRLGKNARKKALKNYNQKNQAKKYKRLYQKLLSGK